jgi:hypothetical protein
MRRVTLVIGVLLTLSVRAGDKKVDVSKVHGRIQFVTSFPGPAKLVLLVVCDIYLF